MATVRLTNQIRREILEKLLEHRFAVRQAEVDEALTKLGDEVYGDVYPKAARDAMAALPDGYFPRSSHVEVIFGAARVQLRLSEERSFAYDHYMSHARAYGARDAKASRFFDADRKRRKLAEEREAARATGKAALRGFRTVGRLVAAWPECEPFVGNYLGDATEAASRALSVPVRDLNKLFGL